MIIRLAVHDDAVSMQEIHTACTVTTMRTYYSEAQTAAWLDGRSPDGYLQAIAEGEQFLIAENQSRVIGFSSWREQRICSLFVRPDDQGRGIGKSLLVACVTAISKRGADMVRVNASMNAIGFYESCGFIRVALADSVKHGVAIPYARMEGALWRIRAVTRCVTG